MRNLIVSGANISFNKHVILNDVSLSSAQNEIIGLFGRNGTGKSTLLKMIFGTEKRGSINLAIDDEHLKSNQVIPQKLISYLPQKSFLPKSYLVRDLINIYILDEKVLDKIFYSPKINNLERCKIGTLSAGELKYIEILLIAYLDHPFMMLDEPFSMVEPLYREVIQELLLDRKQIKGIVITDHYYKDVLDITDRNYLLREQLIYSVRHANELQELGYLNSI